MHQSTFNEVDYFEFRRLIGSERYLHSFIIYDIPAQSWSVLHITDYETHLLKTSENAHQPMKISFDICALSLQDSSREHLRFFIEPRFLGVSLARIILQQSLRGESYTGAFPMPCEDNEPHYECVRPLNVYDDEADGILYNYPHTESTIEEVIVPARQIINYAKRVMRDSMAYLP